MFSYLYQITFVLFLLIGNLGDEKDTATQEFQGKAYYFSKSKMELGAWGARMSEAQKKEIKNRQEST